MAKKYILPTDPVEAQKKLVALLEKDQNDTVCRFFECEQPRKPNVNGGNPPAYCDDPDHNTLKNSRIRAALKNVANGLPASIIEAEQPVSLGAVASLRERTVADLERDFVQLGLYIEMLRESSDPDIAAAQIEAAQQQAVAQIAIAQEALTSERSLRLAAEVSRNTALKDAETARDEASSALTKLQEAEQRGEIQKAGYERQLTRVQQEHEQAIQQLRKETQQQIEEIQRQANTKVAQAEEVTALAQEEAGKANSRAHDAQTEARIAITAAQQRVIELQETLEREQGEVTKLREERERLVAESGNQLGAASKEIQHLRSNYADAITDARTRAHNDQEEIQRLRQALGRATERADELAHTIDTLREQRFQLQTREQPEKPD